MGKESIMLTVTHTEEGMNKPLMVFRIVYGVLVPMFENDVVLVLYSKVDDNIRSIVLTVSSVIYGLADSYMIDVVEVAHKHDTILVCGIRLDKRAIDKSTVLNKNGIERKIDNNLSGNAWTYISKVSI